jgi:hypothetical protein
MVYGRLLSTLGSWDWWKQPMQDEERRQEAKEIIGLTVRYASDDVLSVANVLYDNVEKSIERAHSNKPSLTPAEQAPARIALVRPVRAELAGQRESEMLTRRPLYPNALSELPGGGPVVLHFASRP